MSNPLSAIFEGDITLQAGSDPVLYGFGDLTVNRRGYFNGTENSTNASTGNIVNLGGLGQVGDSYFNQTINVSGGSFLNAVNINTNTGPTNISGANGIIAQVGSQISITNTSGNITLNSSQGSSIIQGGTSNSGAIQLTATQSAGGITQLSGAAGSIITGSGSGGITVGASGGTIQQTSYGAQSIYQVQSTGAGQNLNLQLSGATDSGINIISSGINTTNAAINIQTQNTQGNITISNNNGLGAGSITLTSGTGGITAVTNTGGVLSLTAQGATAQLVSQSSTSGQNILINQIGQFNSGIIIKSEGINNSSGAIQLQTQNTSGSIFISNTSGSTGRIQIQSGSGGINQISSGGSINLTSNSGGTNITVNSSNTSENLQLTLNGTTGSKIQIQSAGPTFDAINLTTTSQSGGIYAFAKGPISIQTTDNVSGINIGTINSGLVNIGKSGQTTTILGNLNVRGTTTIIESTIDVFSDNVLLVNYAPTGISDGGFGIKRYQPANDLAQGNVVNPSGLSPGTVTGTAQAGTSTTITLSNSASSTDNFYNGWWIIITTGTGSNQVRQIKSYVGATRVATIYTTADQTGVLNNPTPVQGLDFSTIPDATSVYTLYPTTFAMNIWNEANNEFAYVFATLDTQSQIQFNGNYANLHINNLIANQITANQINNSAADIVLTVNLTDNSQTPVTITGLTLNYGVYLVFVRPTTATTNRPFAIFMLGRLNDPTQSGTSDRIISIAGSANSSLNFQWAANVNPALFYQKTPGVAGTTNYTLRFLTI